MEPEQFNFEEADDLYLAAFTLLRIAYRIEQGQFSDWRRKKAAVTLLNKISPAFESYFASFGEQDRANLSGVLAAKFINIHKKAKAENWSVEKIRKELTTMPTLNSQDCLLTEDDIPDSWIHLEKNPNKTDQGIVEDANYTWAKIQGYGSGDRTLKMRRQKLKDHGLKLPDFQDEYQWHSAGDYQKFKSKMIAKLLGEECSDGTPKMTGDNVDEMGHDLLELS